jgi:hypothetical protein
MNEGHFLFLSYLTGFDRATPRPRDRARSAEVGVDASTEKET